MIDGIKTTTSTVGGIVVSAVVNEQGHLIITLSNGQQLDTGLVKGPAGSNGDKGDKGDAGERGLTGATGVQGEKGDVGPTGTRGLDGRSFELDRIGPADGLGYYADEARGFSYLVLPPPGESDATLYFKLSHAHGHWSDPIPFNKPVKGDKGDKGDTGPAGEVGPRGERGAGINYHTAEKAVRLTDYDHTDEGFIFFAVDENVLYVKQSNTHGDWKSYNYFRGEKGSTGEKGEKGDTGAGLEFDHVIDVPFVDVKGQQAYIDMAIGTTVLSTVDAVNILDPFAKTMLKYQGVIYRKVGNDPANNDWSDPIRFGGPMGPSGKDGNGLFVDAYNKRDELSTYVKKRQGFTYLSVDTQEIFIKKEDYPFPGQDPFLDYSQPQYNTPEYLAKKFIWDQASESSRFDLLWSKGTIALGPQGEKGTRGEKGDVGEKGDIGPMGQRGYALNPSFKGPGLVERSNYDNQPAGVSYLDTTRGLIYYRQTATHGVWGPGIPLSSSLSNAIEDIEFVNHNLTENKHSTMVLKTKDKETGEDVTRDLLLPGMSYANVLASDFSKTNGHLTSNFKIGQMRKGSFGRLELQIVSPFDGSLIEQTVDGDGNITAGIQATINFRRPSNGQLSLGGPVSLWFNYNDNDGETNLGFYGDFSKGGFYELWNNLLDPTKYYDTDGDVFDVDIDIKCTASGTLPTTGNARLYLHRS